MAFDTVRKQYAKEHFWFVEIVVNATTYRFCEDRTPLPLGLEAVPTLQRVSVAPAEIDLSGGVGVRAKASITLSESNDYVTWGTLSEPARFWARWRAENPYYKGQSLSVYSGYIVNNEYMAENFVKRDYLIESFAQTGQGVSITAKDPLKLASNDRAKAPRESTGALSADTLSTDASFTLTPSGVGDAEYPASGIVRIGDEVISYSSRTGDVFSGLTRGNFNTQAEDHSLDDSVQLCLRYEAQTVSDIDHDLLTNYANVDPTYIDKPSWDTEVSNAFTVTYTTLVTEPTGVQDLLKEFSESAPHYLYWDERVNKIRLTALKPPPEDAPLLTYEGHLLQGKTTVQDKQDILVTTVICNFGIYNPTKDLDEGSNYRSAYIREDSASVTNYGQRKYKVINSRWITSDNKGAAVLMAARIGRRFSEAPRLVSFHLDAKDADVWSGDSVKISTDLILQQGTNNPDTLFYQILSAGESDNYTYAALEHSYGPEVAGDSEAEDPDVRLIYISAEQDQLGDPDTGAPRTLRDIYDAIYAADIAAGYDVRFIFESNAVAGSSSNTAYAVKTGAWPELTTPPLIINNGLIIGKGGDADEDGGPAIQLQNDIRLNNLNIIGGGGGGGGTSTSDNPSDPVTGGGGGGAGFYNGIARSSYSKFGFVTTDSQNGTNTTGGNGGEATGNTNFSNGGNGGDLGQSGEPGVGGATNGTGGAQGKAIDLNGFAITYVETGTISGTVS